MHIDGITLAGQVGVKRANVSERHSNARDSVTHYRSTAHWQRENRDQSHGAT